MNNNNLKPAKTYEEARKRGIKGGIASGKARQQRKALKEQLLLLLSEGETQNNLCLSLIDKALKGDTRAFEVIRDTIGEKPVEKTQSTDTVLVSAPHKIDMEKIKQLNEMLND